MARGGKRPGAGRRRVKPEQPPVNKSLATEILARLDEGFGHGADCTCEKCLWRRDAITPGQVGQFARKYLWDRRDGKPVQTVNHLHDKPIDVNLTLSLGERMKTAMQKAEGRVRNRG